MNGELSQNPNNQSNHLHHKPNHQSSFPLNFNQSLLRAGSRLRPLQQVHAQLIVTGSCHRSLPLLTKLATLAVAAGSILYTRQLFISIPNPDSFLFTSLIIASSKHHFPLDSIFFYRHMHTSNISPSNYIFTAVIKSCAEVPSLRLGTVVHNHVLLSGYGLDSYVQASLVSFYGKCGDLGGARKVFGYMHERTVVAWNSMISGCEQNGQAEEAIGLFYQMRDLGIELDSATFVSVLSACAQAGALDLGCWVHEHINANRFDVNVVLGTALINMYARCGNVGKARGVFDSMSKPNVVTWTAMISGYGMHGYGREAIELFNLMRNNGTIPNDVTFVGVLSACAHAGLVQEGWQALESMREYGLVPGLEHHVCLVNMLGSAGLLNEAFQYIRELHPLKPAPAMWTAMLGACKMHKNFDLGVQVAEHLLAAEPDNPGHYVLLSNMYAFAGRMERVEYIRDVMIRKHLKKHVGYSTIEVDQKIHLFSVGDKSHPETTAIYQYLDELMRKSRDAGYVPAEESVMHQLEEEEREYALRYHSEKLAIAFGLLKIGHGMPIRIIKNLRMCEDCHIAIKFISVISNREIVVRDKLLFHHFRNGSCSCMDYW